MDGSDSKETIVLILLFNDCLEIYIDDLQPVTKMMRNKVMHGRHVYKERIKHVCEI